VKAAGACSAEVKDVWLVCVRLQGMEREKITFNFYFYLQTRIEIVGQQIDYCARQVIYYILKLLNWKRKMISPMKFKTPQSLDCVSCIPKPVGYEKPTMLCARTQPLRRNTPLRRS
jgi:hypothetical protein